MNKQVKHWKKDTTYYVCCSSEGPDNQFVSGLVNGKRIGTISWAKLTDVYLDFKFFEKTDDNLIFCKQYDNIGEFDEDGDIDLTKVEIESMWTVGIKDIIIKPLNIEHQVIKDIFIKYGEV